ncbi:NADH-quinone oxidoreductase subunit J [Profundibacter sp.]
MGVADIAFYIFAICTVTGGLFTVMAKNPVHSVLWLILAFLSAAGLFVLIGAEFIAMLLVIVYVGAVAVLFMFVVMMIDVDFAELRGRMSHYMPIAGLIAIVLLLELAMVFGVWEVSEGAQAARGAVTPDAGQVHNTAALGQLIYDQYIYLFQAAGLILLVAMIGAIVLTLRHRTNIKRQNVMAQMHRDPAKTLEVVDVKPGQGL